MTEQPTAANTPKPIPLADLACTWRTLYAMLDFYNDGRGYDTLVEARRLTEIELRQQHGDEAWQQATDPPEWATPTHYADDARQQAAAEA